MNKNFEITEITQISDDLLKELSLLLINVVERGASVGFLPPLSLEDAKKYWREALTTGVVLWIAQVRGRILGTVQLHLCQNKMEHIVQKLQNLWCILIPEEKD